MTKLRGPLGAAAIALSVVACLPEQTGYVEIRTSPGFRLPPLSLESTKVDPKNDGVTVLRQRVGPARLQYAQGNDLVAFCDFNVRKDRIVTVTVSGFGKEPRCKVQN
jgi:hypothetical protein